MRSLDPITQGFGVRECQTDVLTKKQRVVGLDRRRVQQARELGQIVVRKEPRGILVQESRGCQHFELFVSIEVEDVADAVQHFATDAAVARFEPAERAVVDLGKVGDQLLRQTSLVAEPRQ